MVLLESTLAWFLLLPFALSACYDPSPAFPIPLWPNGKSELQSVFNIVTNKLTQLVSDGRWNTSSFSIELTSNTETLWSTFHSARKHDDHRPGVKHVDGNSQYRIASITKTFTVLAILQQQKAGNLSLDDTVDRYIPELAGPDAGALPWKDITLRILASQLSGIPRELSQSDLINELPDPTQVGLPPVAKQGLPKCDGYNDGKPCTKADLLEGLQKQQPLYAPNFKSTYSNVAFELLGLVIANVTGTTYEDYIQADVLDPLGMSGSSFVKPSDEHAVLPPGNAWDLEEGVQTPTGGLYSSSADMSTYLRHVLTHFNALATGVNWMNPASWATGMNSFYGMPWEIFRTDRLLKKSKRPVTFITKAGALPGYSTRIYLMPEYGLGLTILVAGNGDLLEQIQEIVTVDLIAAAEEVIWSNIGKTHSGSYLAIDPNLNSSITLAVSPSSGLTMTTFISNGTDVMHSLLAIIASQLTNGQDWHIQLAPTLLYKNVTAQSGEIWRAQIVSDRPTRVDESRPVWDDLCITDVDVVSYARRPLTEVVFWLEEGILEMPAWRVKMKLGGEDVRASKAGFRVQGP